MLFYKAPYNPKLNHLSDIGRKAAKREMVEGPRRLIMVTNADSTRIATVEWIADIKPHPYYRVWLNDSSVMGHIPHRHAIEAAENYASGKLTSEEFRQGFHEMKHPNRKARRDRWFGRKPNQAR